MKESRKRRLLAEQLDATTVTSRDLSGLRRFQDKDTGLWGYCTEGGHVVLAAQFEHASHYCAVNANFSVRLPGEAAPIFFDEEFNLLDLFSLEYRGWCPPPRPKTDAEWREFAPTPHALLPLTWFA